MLYASCNTDILACTNSTYKLVTPVLSGGYLRNIISIPLSCMYKYTGYNTKQTKHQYNYTWMGFGATKV